MVLCPFADFSATGTTVLNVDRRIHRSSIGIVQEDVGVQEGMGG